jgi:methionine-S-sulfoxide reductase
MAIETAVLAGGCFWGVEELIRAIPGVLRTEVGYCGGTTENPVYTAVKTGSTGHAEAIEIEFDPERVSFAEILKHFFQLHDPTTLGRQGNDVGSQYRSAVFYKSDAQLEVARAAIRAAEVLWKKPIVTELVPAPRFWSAEEYHQDYLQKNPGGYTCHFYRKF